MDILLKKFRETLDDFSKELEDFFIDEFFSNSILPEKYNVYGELPVWNFDKNNFHGNVAIKENFKVDENKDKESSEEVSKNSEALFETNKNNNTERSNNFSDETLMKYARIYRSPHMPYAGIEIIRAPADVLGYGILGRAFTYLGLIEIREDLYGDEFEEVKTHELTHMQNPHLSEEDVRVLTRQRLPFAPKWH